MNTPSASLAPKPSAPTNHLGSTPPRKHWKEVTTDIPAIYTAATVEEAEQLFEEFAEKWSAYGGMIGMWRRYWNEFISFPSFPVEIRKLIYTTNAIESLNARFRSAIRRRGHFPDEQSALKVLYLTTIRRETNRPNPTGQINGWNTIFNVFAMTYGDRLGLN